MAPPGFPIGALWTLVDTSGRELFTINPKDIGANSATAFSDGLSRLLIPALGTRNKSLGGPARRRVLFFLQDSILLNARFALSPPLLKGGGPPGKARWWWDSSQGTSDYRKSGARRGLGCKIPPPPLRGGPPPFHKGDEKSNLPFGMLRRPKP